MNKALKWLANLWIWLGIAINIAGCAAIIHYETSWWAAWWHITERYSPFNLGNLFFQLVLFSPALGSLFWLACRERNAHRRRGEA